jgi:hypothetical protein
MARKIRVRQPDRKGISITEVTVEEANNIIKDVTEWGALVLDAKTKETIWEVGPESDEIEVIEMLQGG